MLIFGGPILKICPFIEVFPPYVREKSTHETEEIIESAQSIGHKRKGSVVGGSYNHTYVAFPKYAKSVSHFSYSVTKENTITQVN